MKTRIEHLLIFTLLLGIFTTSYSFNLPGEPNKALTIIKTNVEMSENIANPSVNNSVEVVQLTFSEALDMATIQGSVKLFRIDAKGIASELPCYLRLDFNNPAILNINTKPVQKFADGVEYKIEVSGNLKSKSGVTMSSGSSLLRYQCNAGFFNFGNSEVKRNKIVVISDIHLGMDSKFAEINKNFNNLVDLLTKVRTAPDVKELVIGGDLMDQWFVPMNYKTPLTKLHLWMQ
ncbi:MAG: metallophosphoesterase [Ignavibacteriales bacterium]|nr:metallophosphoesterase [Ignavibacteriales bacterium]